MRQYSSRYTTAADWDEHFVRGDSFVNGIRDEYLELFSSTKDKPRRLLELLEDLANAEDSLKREYGGRYLFELLQNADDAMTDKLAQVGARVFREEVNRVAIILNEDSLLVANDGLPFGENNVQALCRLYHSTKSASKQIGHKGIGFKSVLEISDKPEVYSAGFAFGFDRQEFVAEVKHITGVQDLDSESLQILRVPFNRRLAWLPDNDRQQVMDLLEDEYATVIRLPLKPGINPDTIAQQIIMEARPELLLFLESMEQLIIDLSGERFEFWRDEEVKKDLYKKRPFKKVKLVATSNGQTQILSNWLLLSSEEIAITDRQLVADLGKAWEDVQAVKCAAAFRLSNDGRSLETNSQEQAFNVYFPTEEKSGLRFLLNGDLYIEAARKDIRLNAFNKWLAESLALHVATAGVDALKSQFPGDPAIVELLAPIRQPGRAFSSYFLEYYLLALTDTAFVPTDDDNYRPPGEIRFPPAGTGGEQFRRFFPPQRFAADNTWAYPLLAVERGERERHDPFLLREELGAASISLGELAPALRFGPPLDPGAESEFLAFLVDWWYELPSSEQGVLKRFLREWAIIPTQHGWQAPTAENLFQANLRDETEIAVPAGFQLSLVLLDAYGDDRAYDGRTANFLNAMEIRRYQAPEILRRAIFPVMNSREALETLLNENHDAVYAGYRILFDYWERERGGARFDDIRREVQIPCHLLSDPSTILWRPAQEVYFSEFWSGSQDLEILYGDFADGYLLGPVPHLLNGDWEDEEQAQEAKEKWFAFFHWLGVNLAPRLIEHRDTNLWHTWTANHPFSERPLWNDYLATLQGQFDCPRDHHERNPNRRFNVNYALHHFEEIATNADVSGQLTSLFRLLGNYWENYKPYLNIQTICRYKRCGNRSDPLASYFYYCLRHLAWLPAERWECLEPEPFTAADIWHLGADVRTEVRSMLPSLPAEFRQNGYFDIRADILRRDAGFDDYLSLLQRLPEICPVNPPEGIEVEPYKWQRAVRAVFNWLGQAMHNSLDRLGDAHWPQRPDDLPLLAYHNGQPRYVPVNHPLLVYDDDDFIAQEWKEDLWYLKIDVSWTRLRDWLAVPFISRQIDVQPDPSPPLEAETVDVRRKLDATLPAFLAVVHEQQNSRYPNIFGRMQNLQVQVVEELVLKQQFLPDPVNSKEIAKEIHLHAYDEDNPRGGNPRRVGMLYISYEARDNPDILGRPVANYIEIAGLRDTFVLLYDRPNRRTRLRYLENRGIDPALVENIRQALGTEWDEEDVPQEMDGIGEAFQKRFGAADGSKGRPIHIATKPQPDGADGQGDPAQADDQETDNGTIDTIPAMPPLAMDEDVFIIDYQPDGQERQPQVSKDKPKPIVIGGGGGRPRVTEKVTEAYGRRGEKWAFHAERQRLRRLGFSEEFIAEKLRWISHDDKYAVCDIVSVDGSPQDFYEIYIEVKATTGSDLAVNWSINEFMLAQEAGDQYWIYWVGRVREEKPPLKRYQNPVQLWMDKEALLDFRKLVITLPEQQLEEVA